MKITSLFLLLFLMYSCNTKRLSPADLEYVKISTWQWDKGFKIGEGDFVSFDGDSLVFALKDDTIYYKKYPKAIIKRINKNYNELIISSIDTKKSGVYINIEEFTR